MGSQVEPIVLLEGENSDLKTEIIELKTAIEKLEARIVELEAELSRHSGNSSKPPSSDTIAQRAAQKARWEAWGKKKRRRPGKQKGSEGRHLAQVSEPDPVLRYVFHKPVRIAADLLPAPQ